MKIGVFILYFLFLVSCATQPIAEKNWFPDDIIHPSPIAEFINNVDSDDINVVRNVFFTIIAFIEKLNIAHEENIARAYRFDTPTIKCPALINGNLAIIESSVGVTYHVRWDDVLEELVELGPACDIFSEHLQIIHNSSLNNKLLDHWFSLEGELLGEYIDVESLWEKLLEPEYLHSLGFTPLG